MFLLKSFLFTGFICLIAQIIKDNTKLTSGHITSLFVSIGAFLGFLGLYEKIADYIGGGARVVIMSFGNTLYQTAVSEGLFNMLSGVSAGITSAILFSFIITLIFKVKE